MNVDGREKEKESRGHTVTLRDGTVLTGAHLYYEDEQHRIFLKPCSRNDERLGASRYSVLMVARGQVKSVEPQTAVSPPLPSFREASLERAQKKAQKKAQSRQLQLMRLSGQIDELAMRLFMALSKMIPCHWYFEEEKIKDDRAADTAIVVLDELIINPPYTRRDLLPTAEANAATIDWIGQIVERERSKLNSLRGQ